ncbi:MAG: malate synthase G [Rhodobacteraceae bacterium]|nr:malate synthase G [Paracoccaceae bacterium]
MVKSENWVNRSNLRVDGEFARFIEVEALPGTGVDADRFWGGLAELRTEFESENERLLERRSELQEQINHHHRSCGCGKPDRRKYQSFLTDIGYLVEEGPEFKVETDGIDPEIAEIPGPQLVVPITNARFAINAANARWNSLYDALYGTDALGAPPAEGGFSMERGHCVIDWTKSFLDEAFPLKGISHRDARSYAVRDGKLAVDCGTGLAALKKPGQLVGWKGRSERPDSILLRNNGLHAEIVIDRLHLIGAEDEAGVADIILESAVTTIMDCEDSVAVVDAEDKIVAYRNWLGLMKGDLEANFIKKGTAVCRRLASDREFTGCNGHELVLKGQSMMLIRNVGLLMKFPAVSDAAGNPIFEGLLDAICTILIAMHDIVRRRRNSAFGSVYVVKPKLHGPEEVGFTDRVFSRVEQILELPQHTVKIGIMDEERRTTVNLKECIRAARHRVAFINTGFLDRTGDEIHTSMEAGPFMRKADIKAADWLAAYEDRNVDIGLACGLKGKAQIGKGMWAMPDQMRNMLEEKIGHPRAGASTAWVPSPTAATLHATHYHRVDVISRLNEIEVQGRSTDIGRILNIPLAEGTNWSHEELVSEVENNLQGILGYVVRWIDQGIGCSKVPDINDVALMEDRATCRISSQHIANWLHHGVVDEQTVMKAMKRMARVVDSQNSADPDYLPMAPGFEGNAFLAACDLVFGGVNQPSGYTEPILHERRARRKAEH